MFQYSLEEAGERLVEQRRAVKEAETQFRAQYEASKRSLQDQLERVRAHVEEQERNAREGFSNATSDLSAEQREQLHQDIEGSFETIRAEFAKNEKLFHGYLEEAARIIAEAGPNS